MSGGLPMPEPSSMGGGKVHVPQAIFNPVFSVLAEEGSLEESRGDSGTG